MTAKLTINDCKKYAANKGGDCLSDVYKNNNSKLLWKCCNGHTWLSTFYNIKCRNHWCPYCARPNKITAEYCRNLAKSKGGRFISETYKSREKLEWECFHGHRFFATFANVEYNNCWCYICNHGERIDIVLANNLAKIKDGYCLSSEYIRGEKLKWRCSNGHEWHASIFLIKNRGQWCPICSSNKKSLSDCIKAAENKGGHCLSDHYINGTTALEWKCQFGHTWFAKPTSIINQHTWCPNCRESKNQLKLSEILESLLKEKPSVNYRKFDWLNSAHGGRMEIDLWFSKTKLAVEYDGIQHFKPIRFNSKLSDEEVQQQLECLQSRDVRKTQLILERPQVIKYFIRFNYMENITIKLVIDKLKSVGLLTQ